MKRNVISLIMIGILSFVSCEIVAQDNKRGDTDYTNNRKRGKDKKSTVNTQKETPVKIIEYIPGTWKIESVYNGKKDVTGTDTLAQTQNIDFNREGRYVSYTDTEKIDSGAYRINEQHAILYLASESDEKPSEWYVTFGKDGTMTLRMKDGGTQAENIKYIYRRTGSTTTSNR